MMVVYIRTSGDVVVRVPERGPLSLVPAAAVAAHEFVCANPLSKQAMDEVRRLVGLEGLRLVRPSQVAIRVQGGER